MFGLSLLFVIIPIWVPTTLEGDYGLRAKDMPLVAAATITALAAIFFIFRLQSPIDPEDVPPISRQNWLFLLSAGFFLFFVAGIFEVLGFLYAGPVTIAGFMITMGEKRPLIVGGIAIGVTFAIWLFFWQLLKFPLP